MAVPEAEIMGAIGLLALVVNVTSAISHTATALATAMGIRLDSSRNDAIGNVLVIIAALAVDSRETLADSRRILIAACSCAVLVVFLLCINRIEGMQLMVTDMITAQKIWEISD